MSFTATVEEVSATRRKYKIAAEQSVVNKAFEDALTEIQKNAEIKGFRKGKVPAPLVKKFFKGDLSKKAYENVVESGFQAAIKDSPLQIVSYPQIETDQTFDEHSAFSFDATVDVNPIVEIEGYKQLKLKIEPKQLKSAEEELVALKDSLLISRSKLGDKVTDGSLSETGDLVVFDLESTFEGNSLPELKSTGASLIIGRINNSKEVEQALTGLAVEGKREFPWLLSTNFPTPEIAGKTVQAIVTLKSIQKIIKPSWDLELAKACGVETLEILESNLAASAQSQFENNRVDLLRETILQNILQKNAIEVPESLLEDTTDRLIADANSRLDKKSQLDPKVKAVRENFSNTALDQVRGVLVLGHIARQEALKVEDSEVSNEIIAFARQNKTSPQDLIKKFGRQVIEEFRGKVLIEKALKRIVELAEIEA